MGTLKKDNPPLDLQQVIDNLGVYCSATSLVKHYGVSMHTVRGWLKKLDIKLMDRSSIISIKSTKHPVPDDFEIVCDILRAQSNLSQKSIMQYYSINDYYIVKSWLKRSNITIQKRHSMKLPEDFIQKFNNAKGPTELTRIYNVSFDTINRWLNEAELTFHKDDDIFNAEILEHLHHDMNLNAEQIAIEYDVPGWLVRSRMKKYGVINRWREELISKEELTRLHHDEKKTQHEIAYDTGIHQTTISNYMEKYGIEVKTYKGSSAEELQVVKSIAVHYEGIIEKQKRWGVEYDIVIPEFNFAIEYNGLRWHSLEFQNDKKSHYNKFKVAEDNGMRFISLFSDEWYYKKDIVMSIILNNVKLTKNKIYARKCQIREVNSTIANTFYEKNHIQGKTRRNKFNAGLYYNDELVACMTLGLHPRNNTLTLSRFCTILNTNVVGAASRLFKFCTDSMEINSIVSWSDNRWSDGGLYRTLGFDHISNQRISYDYVTPDKLRRISKQLVQKKRLGIPDNITEKDYMKSLNYYQIWDCGKKKWEWKRGA